MCNLMLAIIVRVIAVTIFFVGISSQVFAQGADNSGKSPPYTTTDALRELTVGRTQRDVLKRSGHDIYALRLPSLPDGSAVEITMNSSSLDGYLAVFQEGKTSALVEDDDSAGDSNPRVILPTNIDTTKPLLIVVSDTDNKVGIYDLSIALVDAKSDPPPIRPVFEDTSISGAVDDVSGRRGVTALARIPILLAGGDRFLIEVNSSEFDTALELSRGPTVIGRDDDSGDGTNSRLYRKVTGDRDLEPYVITVLAPRGGGGKFTGFVRLVRDPATFSGVPATLEPGKNTAGAFTTSSPVLEGQRPYALYRLVGAASDSFEVAITPKEITKGGVMPRMTLEAGVNSPIGFAVATRAASGGALAKLSLNFRRPGEILILASPTNLDWLGQYDVAVTRRRAAAP